MSDHDYSNLVRTQNGFLDPTQFPFAPIPPPSSPGSTVKVSIIPAGTIDAPFALFVDPVPNDRQRVNSPAFSFLIENKGSGERVLFDVGVAKEANRLPSMTRPKIAHFPDSDPSKPAEMKKSMHENIKEAEVSIVKLERFDALPKVWVVLAHDEDVEQVLKREGKLWPEEVTDWYKAGWKKMSWRMSLGLE